MVLHVDFIQRDKIVMRFFWSEELSTSSVSILARKKISLTVQIREDRFAGHVQTSREAFSQLWCSVRVVVL